MALKVTATVTRLGFFDKALRDFGVQERRLVKDAVIATADAVANDARALVPISSGRLSRKQKGRPGPGELRNTIRVEPSTQPDALVAYVKAGTGTLRRRSRSKTGKRRVVTATPPALGVYAMAVEYGTPHRGVPAQPYLRPSMDKNRAAHIERVKAAVSRAARSVGGTP